MSKDTDGQAVTESEYSQWEYELHGKQEAETLRLQPTDETAQFLAWHAEVVRLAVLAEREACAKVCDLEFAACWHADAISQAKEAKRCADAIRARGNT